MMCLKRRGGVVAPRAWERYHDHDSEQDGGAVNRSCTVRSRVLLGAQVDNSSNYPVVRSRCGAVLASLVLGAAALGAPPARATDGSWLRMADGVLVTPAGGVAKKVRLEIVSPTIVHVTAFP